MKKFIWFLIGGILIISMIIPVSATDAPWITFINAENVSLDGGGSISVINDSGAIDGKVITCTEKADNADGDGFTLTFTVDKAGSYQIWGRVWYPNISSNSLHYSVNGGDSLVWDFADEDSPDSSCYNSWHYFYLTVRQAGTYENVSPYGSWTVENNDWRHAPNYLNLTAGQHSIHFTGRETDWMIDEFIITELSVDQYDPNAADGNNNFLSECKFCHADWKHYVKDVFAVTGQTAQDYFHNNLYPTVVEIAATAETETSDTVAVTTTVSAPATSDNSAVSMFALLIVCGAAYVIFRKNK